MNIALPANGIVQATFTTEEAAAIRDDLGGIPAVKVSHAGDRLHSLLETVTDPDIVEPRRLTPAEHDRAWHAIEGAEDADPGTILAAVLYALRINPPTVEDEQAASLRRRGTVTKPEIVAYRNSERPGVLLCREHGVNWMGLEPLTSDDLPDGGLCTWRTSGADECGRDVLIAT